MLDTLLALLGMLNPIDWIRKISGYLKRPKVEIYYDPSETYHQARVVDVDMRLGNFVHVMVKNKGKNVAENCAGELRSVERKDNKKGFHKISSYRSVMVLKWAHEKDFAPKDIDPDMPRRLDVCYVIKDSDVVHFFTEKYPSGNQTDFGPGEYKIRIKVKGDNFSSVEKEFIVSYNAGDFNSLRIGNANGPLNIASRP